MPCDLHEVVLKEVTRYVESIIEKYNLPTKLESSTDVPSPAWSRFCNYLFLWAVVPIMVFLLKWRLRYHGNMELSKWLEILIRLVQSSSVTYRSGPTANLS